MKRYQIHITFCDGSNPWLSLPIDEKQAEKHINKWLKYQENNIQSLEAVNYATNKKVHYNRIYKDFEILNKDNTIGNEYKTYKTIKTALRHC